MTSPAEPTRPRSDPTTWTLPRLAIAIDGQWLHDGEEVTHPGILANLWSGLQVDERGHFIQIGPARVPIEVADAPYVVVRLESEADQLVLTLNDLSREALDVAHVAFDRGGVPHCRVKADHFTARFSRAATYQLLERVEYDPQAETATLVLGGIRHALPGAVPRPE